jgi:hypothetical protein
LASPLVVSDRKSFQCDRYALPTTDAERHHTALKVLTLHCVEETRDQDSTRCTNGMTMSDGAAFHIDDIMVKAELLLNGQRHRGKSFIDFDALNVITRGTLPPCDAEE